ncbi:MAG: redox-regulated ATPase YchF [Candidatus Omnitrophota bacterium]|nr:redox-regulated ATPase YchF [Candidatus Omnitrophota bacterium]
MGLSIGIIGLPNIGKSTLFNILTHGRAPASNYPFCTTKPNIGIAEVPDENLVKLNGLVNGIEIIHAAIKVIDIAGLIKGSSHGEGLGNQFLSEIRGVDAILHLVRAFRNPDVAHIDPEINPDKDIEIIRLELALSDLELIIRRLEKLKKLSRIEKGVTKECRLLEILKTSLQKSSRIDLSVFSKEDRVLIKDFQLLTIKPELIALNISEEDISKQAGPYILMCAKLEKELLDLMPSERADFQQELGLKESVIPVIIKEAYKLLGLITFYTVESGKVRAWSIKNGSDALKAASLIHSDIARGFIRAEVTPLQTLMEYGSLAKAREAGLVKIEGKDYPIADKDVVYFRFDT